MQIENEIKVLDIDVTAATQLLIELGFVQKKELSFRRYVYDVIPKDPTAWVRLRTDGTKTTLSFKQSLSDSIDGMKEIEITLDNFSDMHDILTCSGFKPKSYQENNRLVFEGMGCEVTIDSWPLIPPYMEIESNDKTTVEECLKALSGIKHSETTSLSTEEVYKRYGIDLTTIDKLTF